MSSYTSETSEDKSKSSTYWVIGVRHRIEWTKSHREFVNDIIIGVVLGFDYAAKALLVLGT